MAPPGEQGDHLSAGHLETPRPVVFVLGMLQRTGTNYLYDLFRLHPDVSLLPPRWEDHLLEHADRLVGYADAVARNWLPRWRNDPIERARLLRGIGNGICWFLADAAGGSRVVTKATSVASLETFFELFPDAYAVVLVRDGRSVTESAVRSWGFTHATAARRWATAARRVLDFDLASRDGPGRYHIVRYEDLVADLEKTFAHVLRFCDLDVGRYDFDAARNLPLRGSSTDRGERADLNWDPVARPADFSGIARFDGWSARQHRLFDLAAGREQRELGYEPRDVGAPGPVLRARNLIDDVTWRLIRHRPFKTLSWFRRRLRTRKARASRPATQVPAEPRA